jgi:hypothetical protein
VEAKVAEASGRKARAGQLVRLLDVPAERGKRFPRLPQGRGSLVATQRAIRRISSNSSIAG